VGAAVIGNALEWYDFIVYGFLTVVISRLFFPAESEYRCYAVGDRRFGAGVVVYHSVLETHHQPIGETDGSPSGRHHADCR
jgi:hypothetical protein